MRPTSTQISLQSVCSNFEWQRIKFTAAQLKI